jgi:hypothetical protein
VKSRGPVWHPPDPCFACSVLLCHSHCCWSWLSCRQGIPMPATIVPHATTTPPCHRTLPKWREHHCHYTTVSIIKRSTSPSTFTAQSCIHWSHHLLSPSLLSSCFFEHTPTTFRRLRHSSSIKILHLSIPTMWRRVKLLQPSVSVQAFPWSSTKHHKEEAREESHKREPIPHHQLWLIFWRCFILSAGL